MMQPQMMGYDPSLGYDPSQMHHTMVAQPGMVAHPGMVAQPGMPMAQPGMPMGQPGYPMMMGQPGQGVYLMQSMTGQPVPVMYGMPPQDPNAVYGQPQAYPQVQYQQMQPVQYAYQPQPQVQYVQHPAQAQVQYAQPGISTIVAQAEPSGPLPGEKHGIMLSRRNDNFGFIKQDSGEEDMFVLPLACTAFGGLLPGVGTRVVYTVEPDEKSGKPRAAHVRPEPGGSAQPEQAAPEPRRAGEFTGMMLARTSERQERFGFIKPDGGGDDILVLPTACVGFSGILPPAGARIVYGIEHDARTGKPRAANVRPDSEASLIPEAAGPAQGADEAVGMMLAHNGKFGFIKQDNGEPDIFVIPGACDGMAGMLPTVGTRVYFRVETDSTTQRQRAAGVRPADDVAAPVQPMPQPAVAALPMTGNERAGTMLAPGKEGRFGFIKQDCGEEDMFCLPLACTGFNGILPPQYTRVIYTIELDERLGKKRATNVRPEGTTGGDAAAPTDFASGYAAIHSAGSAERSGPY